jgi:hypothetical protein
VIGEEGTAVVVGGGERGRECVIMKRVKRKGEGNFSTGRE